MPTQSVIEQQASSDWGASTSTRLILRAAVIGIPIQKGGELVMACVVRARNHRHGGRIHPILPPDAGQPQSPKLLALVNRFARFFDRSVEDASGTGKSLLGKRETSSELKMSEATIPTVF